MKNQRHMKIVSSKGGSTPAEAEDGSKLVSNFALTNTGEPICLQEYAIDIASIPNIHVLFMQDFDATKNNRIFP